MAASKESVCSSIINVTTSTETSFQVYQHYAVKISKIIASILRISHSLNNSKIYIIIIQNHKLQNKNIALSQKNNSHTYGSIGVEKESIQKKKKGVEKEKWSWDMERMEACSLQKMTKKHYTIKEYSIRNHFNALTYMMDKSFSHDILSCNS